MRTVQKNINFLENPLFFPTKTRLKEWKTENYKISCPKGLAGNRDIRILNALIHKSQLTGSPCLDYPTFGDLLVVAGYKRGSLGFDELLETLQRWRATNISCMKFYSDGLYFFREFYDLVKFNVDIKSGHLLIEMQEEFYKSNLSKYSKTYPLPMLNSMTPTAKRILEILSKNFYHRGKWVVDYKTFIKKIPIENNLTVEKNLQQGIERYLTEINMSMELYRFKNKFFHKFMTKEKKIVFFSVQ